MARYPTDKRYKQWLQSSRWRRLRMTQLAGYPWCEDCLQAHRRVEATEVHHKVPVLSMLPSQQETMMFNIFNLVSLCHTCHMKRHDRKEQAQHQEERAQNKQQAFKEKYGR